MQFYFHCQNIILFAGLAIVNFILSLGWFIICRYVVKKLCKELLKVAYHILHQWLALSMFQKYRECMLFILRLFLTVFSSFTPFFTCSHLFVHFCEETQQSPLGLCIQLWSLNFRILCLISKGSYRHIGRTIVFIRVLKDTNLHSHSRHICQLLNVVVISVTAGAYIYLHPKAGSNLPQYVYKSDVYVYHCS